MVNPYARSCARTSIRAAWKPGNARFIGRDLGCALYGQGIPKKSFLSIAGITGLTQYPTDEEVAQSIREVPMHFAAGIPKQQNWRWYADGVAEPTTALANENTAPTLANSAIIRLRISTIATGGLITNPVYTVLYSTDNTNFTAFGAGNHWNYANGSATEGNTTTTFLTTDGTTHGLYCESGTVTNANIVATFVEEIDVAIQQTANATGSTLYYFRLAIGGAEVVLNSGKTHAQVTTAAAAATYPPDREYPRGAPRGVVRGAA